jgi:hypothetical protein
MSPQEITRLRMTARRCGRLESLLMEIADRAARGETSDRLMGEGIDLLYAVVVAMPPLPALAKRAEPSACIACLTADAGLDDLAGFEPDGKTVRT